jgi:hypothetical protein
MMLNVVVEWLALLLCILVVSDSNLGLGDRLSCLRFFVIFSVSPKECWDSTLN